MHQIRVPGLARVLTRRHLMYLVIVAIVAASGALARQTRSEVAVSTAPGVTGALADVPAVPSYARDVAPILDRACVRCHGSERADKGLRLDSYHRALAGDTYGAVLIPGKSSLSAIVSVVKYGTMPHDGVRLPPEEIEVISRWIDAGAPEG